jgi:bifunctional DNase/RNase
MTIHDLVPMSIKGLMLDPMSNSPIVVLKDDDEKLFLPIWVGIFEANAIALQLENITTPRPMTHDLLRDMITKLDARVTRIVINDLKDATFFAQIRLLIHSVAGDKMLEIDARPSDAIALALRTEAPIYVAQSVLDQAQTITPDGEESEEKAKAWFEKHRHRLPPTLGLLTVNALVAATHLLIPIQSSYFALEGTDDLLETIEKVRARPNPNAADPRRRDHDARQADGAGARHPRADREGVRRPRCSRR